MPLKTIDLGPRVSYLEEGVGDVMFVLVHGLGGSHLNWLPIVGPLAKRGRVIALDLAGFGRTAPDASGASVGANSLLLARFIEAVANNPVVLVGNSMGGLISLRVAAEHPTKVRALVLVAPAAPVPLGSRIDPRVALLMASSVLPSVAVPLLHWRIARLGAEGMARELMKLCIADVARVDEAVLDAHFALARERASFVWAEGSLLDAARSVLVAIANRGAYHAMVDSVRVPTLLLHGARDRLLGVEVPQALAKRRPDWRYVEHPDAGHVPQLETPAWLLGEIMPWLDGIERTPR